MAKKKRHSVVVMMGEAVKRGLEYWRFVITNEAGSQIAVVPFARKKGARKLKKQPVTAPSSRLTKSSSNRSPPSAYAGYSAFVLIALWCNGQRERLMNALFSA
jgi:hypothetical protein